MNKNKKKKPARAIIVVLICIIIALIIHISENFGEYMLDKLDGNHKFPTDGYGYVLLYDDNPETTYALPKEVEELPEKIEPSIVGELLNDTVVFTWKGAKIRGAVYEYKEGKDKQIIIFKDEDGEYYYGARIIFWDDVGETIIWGDE